MQIIQYWSFCVCTQKSSTPLLGICVSTQMNTFWSFCGYVQLLERERYTTQIIQYWSFCDRTQKRSSPLLGICVSTQMEHFWSFSRYAQLLEREKVTPAHTIRRSSNTGVSATVHRHSESG